MNLLLGDLNSNLLTLLGLSKDLLRRDLHGRGILVFNLFMTKTKANVLMVNVHVRCTIILGP